MRQRRLAAVVCLALFSWFGTAEAQHTTWYLAEGSTGFFQEDILIANPTGTEAQVTIKYLLPAGTPAVDRALTVPPRSRVTVSVNDTIDGNAVSAIVTSTNNVPIAVERSMYWGGPGKTGGHNTNGVEAPAMEWFLAEGVSNHIFDEFILVANPNADPVQVEVTYLGDDGVADVDTYSVGGISRRTIWARADLEEKFQGRFRARTFSATVRSLTPGAPIIVERAIYWGNLGGGATPGGTNAAGLAQLSDTWLFGEGFTGAGFSTFVLIANPNETPVTVDTTFFLEDGSTAIDTREISAKSRTNIWVNAEVGAANNKPFSVQVKARDGKPIAAERAMYWGNMREGHVVAGIPKPEKQWAFAEGLEDRHGGLEFETYYLLANATDQDASVTATFYREDGTGFSDTFVVGRHSRFTLPAGKYPPLSNQKFAAFFSSSVDIVAERAVYWGQGWHGGHASAGIPWKAEIGAPPPIAGPQITSISPAYGPVGTDVTIRGSNFGQDAEVSFGGVAAQRAVGDGQTIYVRAPQNGLGSKSVVVTSVGQSATSPTEFFYENPPPPPPPPGTAQGEPIAVYCSAFNSAGVCTRTVTPRFPNNYLGVIAQLAAERGDLLRASCAEHGGNNQFMFEAVRRLRAATGSNRWGLNIKRGSQGLSQDIVAYYYGPEGSAMEGSIQVYIFDIVGNHCGGSPGPNWADQTEVTRASGTIGRWTTWGQSF